MTHSLASQNLQVPSQASTSGPSFSHIVSGGMDLEDDMVGLEVTANSALSYSSEEYKALAKHFGKVHELSSTRAMKTRAKNLVSKLGRLQARLLKIGNLAPVSNEEISTPNNVLRLTPNAPVRKFNVDEIKKMFQYRLVEVTSFRREVLATLSTDVALVTWKALFLDVQRDIADTTGALAALGGLLHTELEACGHAARSSSLLEDKEKAELEKWWEYLLSYNNRLFEQHLVKLKSGHTVSNNSQSNYLIEQALEDALIYCRMLKTFSPSALGFPPKKDRSKDTTHVTLNPRKRKAPPPPAAGKKPAPGNKKRKGNKGTAKAAKAKATPGTNKPGNKKPAPRGQKRYLLMCTLLNKISLFLPMFFAL